jgi:ankyrin repeat protein
MIERGASVNETNQDGRTPLHWASLSGHTATAVALIERGASVNEKNQFVRTPLCLACYYSRSATALVLLENGAGVNDRNDTGSLPCIGHASIALSMWSCE